MYRSYAMDDLEVPVGHRYTCKKQVWTLGVENQLQQQLLSSGGALFTGGCLGKVDYKGAWAGVRMYFGETKSVMRRHREDDPTDWAEDSVFSAVNGASDGLAASKKIYSGCSIAAEIAPATC